MDTSPLDIAPVQRSHCPCIPKRSKSSGVGDLASQLQSFESLLPSIAIDIRVSKYPCFFTLAVLVLCRGLHFNFILGVRLDFPDFSIDRVTMVVFAVSGVLGKTNMGYACSDATPLPPDPSPH